MTRDFKGVWIPSSIWLSTELSLQEKCLLVEIDSLSQLGECFASNEHFAKFLSLSKDRISKLISSLKTKGFLEVKLIYKEGGKSIDKRVITTIGYRQKQLGGIVESNYRGIVENNEDNNTVITNTFTNTINNNIAEKIILYMNRVLNSNFKPVKANLSLIEARLAEGYTKEDICEVINKKFEEWNGTDFEKYLRPSTLFNATKFSNYHGQKDRSEVPF